MIRAILALGIVTAGAVSWHIGTTSTPHYGFLFALAVGLGFMLGILAAVAYIAEGRHAP